MTRRSPYRPRFLPFWLEETIAGASFITFVVVMFWAYPLILEGMAQ